MPTPDTPQRRPTEPARTASAIDIERLADCVYRLMLAELRLERARGGTER